MSASGEEDLPRSMKNLWTLLSGSLSLKSLQFIADELECNQKQLISGVLFYLPHNPKTDSLEELSKLTNLSIKPRILNNLSVFLNLNTQQCLTLFQSYLLYEYKGTPEMAKSLFSNEKQLKELFDNLWFYYHSERLFSLFCFKQILSNWKTTNHIYGKIFQDFLKHINLDGQLQNKLMEQLKYLLNFNFEARLKCVQYFTEKFHVELKENIVKEQNEILQLLLLYYKNFEPTAENTLDLMNLFVESGFNCTLSKSAHLNALCGFLKALLVVECIDPNYLYKSHVDGIEHYIFKSDNREIVRQLSALVESMNNCNIEHSLVFMSWMVVCVLDENAQSDNSSERLGNASLQLKIFKYITQCLNSPIILSLKGSFVHSVIYEVVGSLLAVTFSVFDFVRLILNEPSLSDLLIQLFSNDTIGKMIFESSLATGLGLSLRHALDLFPFKTHFLLSLLHSLSQTSSCKNIFEKMSIINTLTSYTESTDSLPTHFTQVDSESFVMIQDKHLFGDLRTVIKKGTRGSLFHFNGSRLIRWTDVVMDGWRVLHGRLKTLVEHFRLGQMYSSINDEVVLNEVSKIAFICSELIAHNSHHTIPHFREITSLLLDLFKLVISSTSYQSVIRLFVAGAVQLCVNMIKFSYLPTEQIWYVLTEKKFFPYMIGFANQFGEILAGTDTNISTLGYILTSDEFIKGNYELTFSFLSLILTLVRRGEFLNENLTIASFIFIIKDIFPSYRLWNYSNEIDAHHIGRMCMEIFYHLLNRVHRKSTSELKQIEKVCTMLLMEGNAAEYLLSIIKNGEEVVKQKILASGNESLLAKDDQIVTVRTSLLVLSYLLELYSQVSSFTSGKSKSVIEDIIFSSSSNNSNPNMLLIFTYFVYQKYDIYLSINAIQLLSQLAFKFPMSMLACFGSNTEFIRDHFLLRLETVTEDINFKIALLNFLSICVEHQPGLVEMFLNDTNNQASVLNSILEIFEEKLDGQYFCPYELHHASLQFVAKFWLRPNIIAINLLKKNGKFWKLVTFPLFSPDQFDNSLCSFILKILSREIFYIKMLEKNSLNKELEEIFDEMKNKKLLTRLSRHIRQELSSSLEIAEETINFIDAWKDFLTSWEKFMPLHDDLLASSLIDDIINNILVIFDKFESGQTFNKLINKLSNLLVITSSNLKHREILNRNNEFHSAVIAMFSSVNAHKEEISFNSLISFDTFLLNLILSSSEWNQISLFQYVCERLNSTLKLLDKQFTLLKEKHAGLVLEKRLFTLNLFILVSMFQNQQHDKCKYLDMLRQHEMSQQVFNLLLFLIHNGFHLDLAQCLPTFFVAVSHDATGAELLHNLNIVNNIAIYFNLDEKIFESKVESIHANHVTAIFLQLIRTVINMTVHLHHHFIESCISFVAIYLDTFREICRQFRQSPTARIGRLVLLIAQLCHTLSKYAARWKASHPISLKAVTHELLLTSNAVVAFVLRPNILVKLMEQFASSSGYHSKRLICTDAARVHDDIQTMMDQILIYSLKFLLDVSPNLFELLEDENALNEKHNLLISTNFSLPNEDSNEVLTFGSLINLINYVIGFIYKSEKDMVIQIKDSKSSGINQKIHMNIALLELSLTLFLVQTLIAKNSPNINQIDKQIFFREINNEVNTFKSNLLSKPHRRQNSFSTLTSASPIKSSNINLLERNYIKFVIKFLENMIQCQ